MRRLALAALLIAAPAAAQSDTCRLDQPTGAYTVVGEAGSRVINASGPVVVLCSGGAELRSDSAVLYEALDEVHLFRQVDFQDPTRALTSDRATYNSGTGRLRPISAGYTPPGTSSSPTRRADPRCGGPTWSTSAPCRGAPSRSRSRRAART